MDKYTGSALGQAAQASSFNMAIQTQPRGLTNVLLRIEGLFERLTQCASRLDECNYSLQGQESFSHRGANINKSAETQPTPSDLLSRINVSITALESLIDRIDHSSKGLSELQ